jgi:hypothetical protein
MTTTAFPAASALAPGAALGLVHLDLSITGMTPRAPTRWPTPNSGSSARSGATSRSPRS